jgi:hypothetical protein
MTEAAASDHRPPSSILHPPSSISGRPELSQMSHLGTIAQLGEGTFPQLTDPLTCHP